MATGSSLRISAIRMALPMPWEGAQLMSPTVCGAVFTDLRWARMAAGRIAAFLRNSKVRFQTGWRWLLMALYGSHSPWPLKLLCLSSMGLYGAVSELRSH